MQRDMVWPGLATILAGLDQFREALFFDPSLDRIFVAIEFATYVRSSNDVENVHGKSS